MIVQAKGYACDPMVRLVSDRMGGPTVRGVAQLLTAIQKQCILPCIINKIVANRMSF